MKDKLLIITRLKKTYEYVDNCLDNFPHKYLELRNMISATFLEMIEIAYLANNGVDRKKNQLTLISKLSMVDYYIKLSYKKELVSKKKYEGISRHLLEISNMTSSWLKNDEKGK